MYDPKRGYPTVVPYILYDDLPAAVQWLSQALGFREIVRAALPDGCGWTAHSELERDGYVILLGRRGGQFHDSSSITQVYVDDVAARCDAAAAAGGTILERPAGRPWGVHQAVVADPEKHRWLLTQHVRDTDPADWFGEVFGPIPG